MKTKIVILAACSIFIYACGGTVRNPTKPDIAHDTLTYIYKTLRQRAGDCGNKPDSACTVVKVTYPEFKNAPALNDTAKLHAVKFFKIGNAADTSFKPIADLVISAYQKDVKSHPDPSMFYSIDTKETVIRQDSSITTLQIFGYAFLGGAHGNTSLVFINWNTKANKVFTLDDILVPGYLPKLNAIAEEIFRKNENLSDTASLKADYFFKDAKFSLNHNFLITPLGIRFLYNNYEIKPFAAGRTDLLVPYTRIKDLLKPNTVTAQYLN